MDGAIHLGGCMDSHHHPLGAEVIARRVRPMGPRKVEGLDS